MIYRPFTSLLIANRGEIACRIMRTAKRMGLRTIAVYSEADKDALHVRMADSAVYIGPAAARESYLSLTAIIKAAQETGAEAIHPGYGFLSENASFADAIAAAGLVFVGPPASAIRAMGDKANAKKLMAKGGGPLLPGYEGDDQSDAAFIAAAEKVGFPLILKPSAGGGGKGMKVAHSVAELKEALPGTRSVAKSSFGDERLILERFLARPRHVEVQIFADSHGNAVHLFERDCTLQRRHQKVIEEAPAPDLPQASRDTLHKAAVMAATAVGYVGAGTVEFLLEDGKNPYFMEMNTRLQVEHPVTESITGYDLVEWQLRVAMGEKLPAQQNEIKATGHAVEARLYAEDAAAGFLPQTGTIEHLHFPTTARIDSGVVAGDAITIHYDPMIAKVITTGADRKTALANLAKALDETEVIGLTTNRNILRRLARNAVFTESPPDINWLDREVDGIIAQPKPEQADGLLAAAILSLGTKVGTTPWTQRSGWKLNLPATQTVWLRDEAGVTHQLSIATDATTTVHGVRTSDAVTLFINGDDYRYEIIDPLANAGTTQDGEHHIRAPMPGRVIAVHVKDGQKVERGSAIIVLEAMKMEHTLRAPADGVVKMVRFAVGDQVTEGTDLIEWEPAA